MEKCSRVCETHTMSQVQCESYTITLPCSAGNNYYRLPVLVGLQDCFVIFDTNFGNQNFTLECSARMNNDVTMETVVACLDARAPRERRWCRGSSWGIYHVRVLRQAVHLEKLCIKLCS